MKCLAIIWFCFLPSWCMAQDSTWVALNHPAAGCSWLMPSQPSIFDTLQVRMYSLEMDSTLGVTVHFILGVSPDTLSTGLFYAALDAEQDTLRAMAQVLLFASGSVLNAIADTTIGSVPALDLIFTTPADGNAEDQVTQLRLIYNERRFITFGISAPKDRLIQVIQLGNTLNSSIQFVP